MKRVVIESPYAGDVALNEAYALRCMRDSLDRGEAPFASHLLYTRVLNDTEAAERGQGLKAGQEWIRVADLVAAYVDHGMSPGMSRAIELADKAGIEVELRHLTEEEKT